MLRRNVPVRKLKLADGETLVATVHDLIVAHYGVDRGLGGLAAESFDDDTPYTPAWAEKITGVPRDQIIATARDFASNAEKTNGKSMIILGAGVNHWYHMDMIYRGIINLLVFCGCVGQSGGGWSHYVGQEKLRPQTGWAPLAFALDWHRPPRHMFLGFTIFLIFPFTRLVHVWSAPVGYLFRNYQVVRTKVRARPAEEDADLLPYVARPMFREPPARQQRRRKAA